MEDRKSNPLPGFPKHRVLVADDDLNDLLYYSAVLFHHGYEVRSIASYAEAAACLEREDFDLIIVSQGSSNFEGRRVLARAIEKDRHTPVLVFTRFADMSCYLEAIQAGALDYLEKPLPPSEIARLVMKHLRAQPGMGSASRGRPDRGLES
jgi:two-component system C4-dicarboxylate transport response regulator DctD